MNESHQQFQVIFEELPALVITEKIKFLEELLFYFTITGRAICSETNTTDPEKTNALMWMNELLHSIWNIRFALQAGDDHACVTRLYDHLKFCSQQSALLNMHIIPTVINAFGNYKIKP